MRNVAFVMTHLSSHLSRAFLFLLSALVIRYVPIIAGSAVGRKADSRKQVKARGQFQTFDTKRGWVGNQARWVLATSTKDTKCINSSPT